MASGALQRSGFVFYETYYRIMRALDGEACKALLSAMCEYALYGDEPKGFENDLVSGLWFCFQKTLYEGRKNAQNRAKKPQERSETAVNKPETCPQKERSVQNESAAPEKKPAPSAPVSYEDEMTEEEREYVRPLQEMGIEIDECIGEMDVDKIKEEFEKSQFLQKTFRSVSKIARNYDKVINGVYRDGSNFRKSSDPPKESFQRHAYSKARLQNALVKFDEWET